MSDSDYSSSDTLIAESSGEEEPMGAYGRQYMPYQNELLLKSAEILSDEDE